MHLRRRFGVCRVLGGGGEAQVRFNRDIRPIMAETCFRCHGPDKSSRMAGMRLDIREEALKPTASGVTPIVPGDPDEERDHRSACSPNGARIMPPAFAHKELTPAQKDTIRHWVAEGAKYEGHWAYQPVQRPAAAGGRATRSTRFICERAGARRSAALARGRPPHPDPARVSWI